MEKTMTQAELQAEIARLQGENTALKAKQPKAPKPTCKVSQKGAMSLYGLGRFPVTLYKSQWNTLLNHVDDIRAFIAANPEALKDRE